MKAAIWFIATIGSFILPQFVFATPTIPGWIFFIPTIGDVSFLLAVLGITYVVIKKIQLTPWLKGGLLTAGLCYVGIVLAKLFHVSMMIFGFWFYVVPIQLFLSFSGGYEKNPAEFHFFTDVIFLPLLYFSVGAVIGLCIEALRRREKT